MTICFNKIKNGVKVYCSKSISFSFYPKHWRLVNFSSNGATKNDSCYNYNIHFLGVFLSYTNWDYNKSR